MQCASYVPLYFHGRNLNVRASDFTWHSLDSNSSGEERGYSISMHPNTMDQYIGYDKEVLKQIIQDHEATFRYQVQELHRLYRRQREMMDEMRVREIFAQHLLLETSESVQSLSQAQPVFSQIPSHATSRLLRDLSRTIQSPSNIFAEKSCNVVKFQSTNSEGNENRILDIVFPEDVYHDDQGKQFKEGNHCDVGSVKTGDSSGLNLNNRKTHFFIDLNVPVELESLPSSYTGPSEMCTSHMEIDLNSMPISCSSDTEIALEKENIPSVKEKYNRALKNEEFVKDHPFVDNNINERLLKSEIKKIDLNMSIKLDGRSPPVSSEVKPAELVGPLSPENEERSPPRGTSEDIQVETPLLSEQWEGEGELYVELDTIAAQTLVTISSSRVSDNTLCWFAEIVSSIGDDLENEKEMGTLHGNVRTRVSKQYKDFQTDGSFRRKTGRKACVKPRKYSKLSTSDVVKKSISSILKQPVTHSRQGVLQSWGQTRKRQGGQRGRAGKFLVPL